MENHWATVVVALTVCCFIQYAFCGEQRDELSRAHETLWDHTVSIYRETLSHQFYMAAVALATVIVIFVTYLYFHFKENEGEVQRDMAFIQYATQRAIKQ